MGGELTAATTAGSDWPAGPAALAAPPLTCAVAGGDTGASASVGTDVVCERSCAWSSRLSIDESQLVASTRFYVRERTGLIAAYGLALYLPFFGVLGTIWVEPVAAFWLTLAAFFMVRSFRGGRRDHLWAGIALAMLALSRVEYGYVLMAALVLSCAWFVASRRSRAARRSTLAVVLALLPAHHGSRTRIRSRTSPSTGGAPAGSPSTG